MLRLTSGIVGLMILSGCHGMGLLSDDIAEVRSGLMVAREGQALARQQLSDAESALASGEDATHVRWMVRSASAAMGWVDRGLMMAEAGLGHAVSDMDRLSPLSTVRGVMDSAAAAMRGSGVGWLEAAAGVLSLVSGGLGWFAVRQGRRVDGLKQVIHQANGNRRGGKVADQVEADGLRVLQSEGLV